MFGLRSWRARAIVPLFASVLAACGGGGGGGGDSGLSYSGSTSAASVSSTNAAALGGGAYRSGDAGTSVDAVTAALTTANEPVSPRSIKIATVLKNALSKIDPAAGPTSAAAAMQQGQVTIDGLCGGSLSYSFSFDDVTGSFSGTMRFNAYCEEAGESISGQMSFSGLIDVNTFEFMSFQTTVSNFNVDDGADSFVVSGTISLSTPSATVTEITQNLLVQDGSGPVYRLQDFVVTLTDTGAATEVSMEGRFFHPTYGYVDVVTTTPFNVADGGAYPTSGSMSLTGAGGSHAVLTAFSNGTYQLQIDANGDATFETTLTGNWVDL